MNPVVHVVHDAQRKVLETISLFRVMSDYFRKKAQAQENLQPQLVKLRRQLDYMERNGDWLFSLPSGLNELTEAFSQTNRDAFRFPNSIILFEAWMKAGMDALFPRLVVNFDFPGIRRQEKTRHVFEFIFATSRGFGLPITFAPPFYGYEPAKTPWQRTLTLPFQWVHTINRKANKLIAMVDRKYNVARHHPGEFESLTISRYGATAKRPSGYYGVDTVLHGFRDKDRYLGDFASIEEVLDAVTFSYSIGDHAIRICEQPPDRTLPVKLLTQAEIQRAYDIDFQPYLKHVIHLDNLIRKRIQENVAENERKLEQMPRLHRWRVKLRQKFSPVKKLRPIHLSRGYTEEAARIQFLNELREDLWNTPLYSHAILEEDQDDRFQLSREKKDSVLLMKAYNFQETWGVSYDAIIADLQKIRDEMARIYFYFKARHLEYASRRVSELSRLSRNHPAYMERLFETIDEVVPIFTIYEILQRPLSDSAYPEMAVGRQRLWSSLALFFGNKYNPLGVSLMKLHNRLAFKRWAWFVHKHQLSLRQFYEFVAKIPIWHLNGTRANKKNNADGPVEKARVSIESAAG